MACCSSVIPRCAVELLFAEDLIDRIMRRHTGVRFKAWRAAPYRDFILNAFSEDIGEAVDFIDMMLEWEVDDAFSKMVDEHRVDRESFINYALYFEDFWFKQGFDADCFLDFSVRLVSLAVYFAQYGKPLALDLALFFIVKVMANHDLFEGGWDTLNAVAKKYVERKEDFCSVLTPDVSDDEPLLNALGDDAEEDDDDDEYDFVNEGGGFVMNEEEKPKDEVNRQRLDSSDFENVAGGYLSKVDDESAINQEEKPQEKPDLEGMDFSGAKLDLPATSEIETEGYISDRVDESSTAKERKPQNTLDRERMDLSGSKLDLPVASKNETERYISNRKDESAITKEGKPLDELDREKMDLSGLKLDFPAFSESKEEMKTGIPSDM